jgi:single-strand DNA-binding protein
MNDLNRWTGLGNLTRDPDIKYTKKGNAMAEVSLALNRSWLDDAGQKKEQVTFVEVTFYGRTAEVAGEYLKRGRQVYVEGRLVLEAWEDKDTGKRRSKLKVMGETLRLLGSGGSGGSEAKVKPVRVVEASEVDFTDEVPF